MLDPIARRRALRPPSARRDGPHGRRALALHSATRASARASSPPPECSPATRAELSRATARSAAVGAAVLLRAFALDFPAACVTAGARRADGLRLVPGPSRAAAAIVVSSDPWLMPLVVDPALRDALGRATAAYDEVAGAYRSHPDPGGHAYGPPDAAFDGPGMDRLERGAGGGGLGGPAV